MPKSPALPAEQDRMMQRYRAIEQPVLVWVISAARKCGLNLLGLRTGAVYSQAHEEVSLSTYDLQPLSDLIAKSKARVEIPELIAKSLDEIIDLRTKFSVWYPSNTAASDSKRISRNKTHRDRTAEWQQARKRVRHLYPPSMLHNPRMKHSKDALISPADKPAAQKMFSSQSSNSENDSSVERKSITMTGQGEDVLSAGISQENKSFGEDVSNMGSESLLQDKRLTEEVLERDEKLRKHEICPPEESPAEQEGLNENAGRASASEESQHPSANGFEVQSAKNSENNKRKRHKREERSKRRGRTRSTRRLLLR